MTFSSLPFLFYFLPAVLILYYVFFFSRTLQNMILLVFSLLFYTWGEPKDILLLVASIVVNYIMGLLVCQVERRKHAAKFWLICSLIFNIGMLFVFKYLTFATKNISFATGGKVGVIDIALPIGISFFTFHAISYVVDVYRGDSPVQKNIFNVALYLSFFPKLTQGPITKYKTFEPQLLHRQETLKKFSSGTCFFIVGLGKKVLIANNIAIVADRVFSLSGMSGHIPVSLAWIGALAYTFQIYFDFSGYSDMAIGLGLMFGFQLDQNFDFPYISKSIREFWRRWHISLGMWFRDYVYFPLGGSRVSNKDLIVRNLAVVWILTGVWHGANWTFLIWGILQFICIAAERMLHFETLKIPNAFKHIYAMFIVIIGWVIFRSDSLQAAGQYIACMFNFVKYGFYNAYTYMFLREFWLFFLASAIFSVPIATIINQFLVKGILIDKKIQLHAPYKTHSVYAEAPFSKIVTVVYPVTLLALFLVCIVYLVKGSYNPFIYFKF